MEKNKEKAPKSSLCPDKKEIAPMLVCIRADLNFWMLK